MAGQVPPALKAVQPFLVISRQFTKRDPVVSYYGELKNSNYAHDYRARGNFVYT